jgi:hypothetical protein
VWFVIDAGRMVVVKKAAGAMEAALEDLERGTA